jgi:alkylation response protein AidB-like acyl-CoA dehydrogenase
MGTASAEPLPGKRALPVCQWLPSLRMGLAVSVDGARRGEGNWVPETRQCFLRLSQCEILDTWYTTGLCGTGSNDLVVRDVFVPEEHTFSFQDPQLIKRSGPLYAFPFMFIAKGPGTALGIARHAIDSLVGTAAESRRGATRSVRVWRRLRCFATMSTFRTRRARAHVFDAVGDLWASLLDGRQPTDRQLALFTTLYPHSVGVCADVVQLVYKAAGGAAVYQKGPLDRCLRDVLTANQHVVATMRTYEMAGRLLLGLEPLRFLF